MRRFLASAFAATLVVFALAAATSGAEAETATIETDLGTITVALDSAAAPKTVANFIAYAKEGHFDGTVVYRVVPGFVIQMGSYDATGNPRAEHAPIPLESGNGLKNLRGTLSMARGDDPTSATAEFFINLSDNTDALDPKPDAAPNTTGYAVFGKVTGGQDVVDKIAASVLNGGKGPFPDAAPAFPVTIHKVTVGP
ncbi:MAG TPA: peptidylprolyl isomerase [Rhizomicrobium sp.]|jgi:cyclophilin family peptidyl-prolyl cis-trans isomerase